MEKIYDIVTVLDCCVDLVLSGADMVPKFGEQEQFIHDYTVEMGGSGCIFAVHLIFDNIKKKEHFKAAMKCPFFIIILFARQPFANVRGAV